MVMLSTPRNNFKVSMWGLKKNKVGYLESVDALYEIADAEFNSDKAVHDEWNRLAAKFKTFKKSFMKFIFPRLCAINGRENLGLFSDDVDTVMKQIYLDWEKQYGS